MKFTTLLEMIHTFDNEDKCIKHLETLRWPNGIVCPHCGSTGNSYRIQTRKIFKCGDCKKQFSVRVGTIFEGSPISLQKWFMAIWLITSHKKGISSNQLHKDIGVTQKTAWFMLQRLREVSKKMTETGPVAGRGIYDG
jgi:transposase-like protein